MIEQRPDNHLSYDELLKVLAQTGGETNQSRDHLQSCISCQQALKRVEQRFKHMGNMARQLSPKPSSPFRLSGKKDAYTRWHRKSIWVTGLAAAAIMLMTAWFTQQAEQNSALPEMAMHAIEQDRQLMEQVNALVDNALPAKYQNLTYFPGIKIDEDLINWIVPSIDEEKDNSLT
ncbi:MAG: hypothetical protein GY874_01870 [Desulfobacteraceae bacterium]|nr:hypothetical protein [Desulfobacteraceae bacterium]